MASHVVLVTTLDANLLYFYEGLIPTLIERGHRVTAISSPGPRHPSVRNLGADVIPVPIRREPAPRADLRSLLLLRETLRRTRADLIVLSTPKGGLVGAAAAFLAGQRSQTVYIIRGRAYENMPRFKRSLFVWLERLTCLLSNRVIVISSSLKEALIADRVAPPERLELFAAGSSKGVDVGRFSDSPEARDRGLAWRQELGISDTDVVIGYIGWLRAEKGTPELIEAFREIVEQRNGVHLLLVGEHEEKRDPIPSHLWQWSLAHPRVHLVEWMDDPSVAFNATDVFAFPSHREGFGNVALEAAASGLPVVATNAVGVRDAVVFNETALPSTVSDVNSLKMQLIRLVDSPGLRERLGAAGRDRVVKSFSADVVLKELRDTLGL